MNRVVVEVQGGLVASVTIDALGVEVYVVDRDIEERSETGDWPGGEAVTALGGEQVTVLDPVQVTALLGEIAEECGYCEGTGNIERKVGPFECPVCKGRGFRFPYAEPAGTSSLTDPGCPCGLADRDAPGHEPVPGPRPGEVVGDHPDTPQPTA